MKKKLLVFSPLIIVLGVCVLLLVGLQQDPKKLASALIGKPVPEFYQTNLLIPGNILTNKDLPKEPHLINIWGSWCHYCKEEHPFLMELAGQGVKIIGLNYRDKAQSAVEFLHKSGNPFLLVVDDSQGKLAMQLGVDGAPETYLVDEHGVIRYRYSGAIDKTVWRRELLPELEKLRK